MGWKVLACVAGFEEACTAIEDCSQTTLLAGREDIGMCNVSVPIGASAILAELQLFGVGFGR